MNQIRKFSTPVEHGDRELVLGVQDAVEKT